MAYTILLRKVLERFLESTVIGLMGSLAVLVIVGVGFRRFGASLVWYDEVASILLCWLTYYGASLAVLKKAHIGFPMLAQRLEGRTLLALIVIREVGIVSFFLVVAWAGVRVLSVLEGASLVSLPAIPLTLTHSVIPIGAVLFVVSEIVMLATSLHSEGPNPEEVAN